MEPCRPAGSYGLSIRVAVHLPSQREPPWSQAPRLPEEIVTNGSPTTNGSPDRTDRGATSKANGERMMAAGLDRREFGWNLARFSIVHLFASVVVRCGTITLLRLLPPSDRVAIDFFAPPLSAHHPLGRPL